ncbi:tRNA (adenosine(37)-N6)-dimethylallyltransferase MiaA [Chenggangzhangella methanolivorans]|uniref:tRNA dimethylallyltransferase n=1 Tax=Chenggangzhangella methanolivorans TaxID=1437009 RepID=A0A9E6UQE9_9HYPH|nr:tRNA (adenosine(37)-N6)-dimethylallyltransferase MiaA [Chenggangzhangella methanolivorans]QZO00860.1 tRNA (adenosine(37)-N6)-dimethylallyltransferase MiaA [Chenggangzhangella methanolivorans]
MAAEPPIRAVLIAGPTASGKSALALALAERCGGVVANADASQVYADLRVLSARPSEADEARAPHALYGHVDAAEAYAVGRYLDDVHRVINRLSAGFEPGSQQAVEPGRVPIFVGGTGLYLEALTAGLAAVPAIPDEVRVRWRSFGPAAELHAELARRDPEMAARLRPTDPQRLIRALEVLEATGRSLARWQEEATRGPLDPAETLRIALAPDRAILRERIAARLDGMARDGAVEEAAKLDARSLDPALPAMKALGVRPLAAHARGEISLDEALERTRLDTGRYAKRQSTWFRNRMPGWLQAAPDEALELAIREIGRRGTAPPPLSRT